MTLLLKITRFLDLVLKLFKNNNNEVVKVGDRINKIIIHSSKNNKSKNLMYMPNIRATREFTLLISNIKKVFNYLKLAFIKALIFWYFDL